MSRLYLKVILIGIVAHPLVEFVIGQRVEIPLGRYWTIMHLVLMMSMALWLLTKMQEQWPLPLYPNSQTPILISLSFRVVLLILFFQTIRGIHLGYYSALGDAETLFWIAAMIYIGWSAPLDAREWKNTWHLFIRFTTGLVTISAISSLGRTVGIPLPGYIYYDLSFLMILTFFSYYARIFLQGSTKNSDSFGLIISLAGIVLSMNKAIILSLILAFPVVLSFRKQLSDARKRRRHNNQYNQKTILFLLVYSALVLLFVLIFASPSFSNNYLYFWQERILHGSNLSDFDIDSLSGGRADLWESSMYWIGQKPWYGQGIGFRLQKDADDLLLTSNGISAHNQYIYFFTALGIPGGTLVIALLISYYVWVLRRISQKPFLVLDADWVHSLLGYAMAMFAFGLVGIWNIAPAAYVLFGLSIGLLGKHCASKAVKLPFGTKSTIYS